MTLENNLYGNYVEQVELIHTYLYKQRHIGEDMKEPYEQFLDELNREFKVPQEFTHSYYINRYKYDWRTNEYLLFEGELPSFLKPQTH